MRYHNLVFDTRVLLDAATNAPESEPVKALLLKVADGECSGWIAAQSLPALQAGLAATFTRNGNPIEEAGNLAKAHLRALFTQLKLLTLPGEESLDLIEEASNIEEAQIALAALALGKDACIVTSNPLFDARGKVPTLSPSDALTVPEVEGPLPFIDLATQERRILPSLEKRIRSVTRHCQFIMGPEVLELEARLADYVGVRHAISCSSGTDALLMPLMAYGIGPGDAVFTSPFTFVATAEAISLVGATPVFVDIDPVTYNIDPVRLDEAIQALKTGSPEIHTLPRVPNVQKLVPRAVIPVDLFGLPADYDAIATVCSKHGLKVIEDAAQSFGAIYKGRRAGSLADVGSTSFFPAKPLGCYGDGGAVFTDDDELADRMLSIRVHGQGSDKYENVRIGLNARFDTLQAAILLAKLEVFDDELERRQSVAERYTEEFHREAGQAKAPPVTPTIPEGSVSAWAQYSLLSEHRTLILEGLAKRGIPSAIYYPKPLHLQTAYRSLAYRRGDFPVSESTADRVFSVPMHPYLPERTSRFVAETVKFCLK